MANFDKEVTAMRPYLDRCIEMSKRNIATISPGTVAECAHYMNKLLKEWKGPKYSLFVPALRPWVRILQEQGRKNVATFDFVKTAEACKQIQIILDS